MNPSNDPSLKSFIDVAPESHFPIQNLPYCAFKREGDDNPQIGVRIGDYILDLKTLEHDGFFKETALGDTHVFCKWALNKFMAQGREAWSEVRRKISELLRHDNPKLRDDRARRQASLLPVEGVELCLPVEIGDYTDFYSSKHHAFNVGTMFRGPENALMPNYLWVPVGYHGRAGSVVLSGTNIRRPCGQTKADDADQPSFGPSRLMDFELEMGFFTGPGNLLGEPIAVDQAPDHIFGMVIVNDWSARDVQKWEYVPLGPFLAKNFGTSISPYVVAMEALEPFRCAGPEQSPKPLPYLRESGNWSYDVHLEVLLQSPKMDRPHRICASNLKHLYWSIRQQLAHHTVTGCNVRPGDLMASGTISGPEPESYGSMLELAWRGTKPIRLPNAEERKFIQDYDQVTMTGWCQGNGYRVGFGEVTGTLLPAQA